MMILHWAISTGAILIGAYLIPGVEVTLVGAVVLAVVLAIINVFIKPVLLLLTLPLTILTLGLFSFVINAALLLLAAKIVPDFSVSGFWVALVFSIVVSIINTLFSRGLGAHR